MRRFYRKMVLYVLLVIFCIFFGVDIAHRGMQHIQGPTPSSGAAGPVKSREPAQTAPSVRAAAPAQAMSPAPASALPVAPKPQAIPAQQDESLNFVGNKTGDLLQIVAHHTIRFVVSLFSSLIG